MSVWTAAAIYFGLSLLYFLPAFLPGRHIYGTDYLNAGFFFYDFIRERISEGSLPKWVPYVYGGLPLFSNPGSTYYPVRWIADLVGSTRLFFPILFWIQFGVAGWGMYLLSRELGCRTWVAFLAGLAWQWTGITTSWVYAGHDGRIIVVTLAPLVLYFLHQGVRTGRLAPFAGASAALGCALLSFQIQNAYYLLLASALWAVFSLVHLGVVRRPGALARTAALGLAAAAFAFTMAAVNFLPFLDYVSESPRGMTGGRGYEYSTSYSMPPRAILGMAVPEQVGATIANERGQYVFPVYRGEGGFRLHTEYLGALVLILASLAAVYVRRNRYVWFFGGLALLAFTMALGGHTPLYRVYYEILPGLKRFRAPDLTYYLLAISLVVIAALTLEAIAAAREAAAARRPRGEAAGSLAAVSWAAAAWPVLGVLGAIVIGGASAEMAQGTVGLTPAQGWMRFAAFAALIGGALWAWTSGRLATRVAVVALAVLTTADLWLMGKKFFQTVDGPETMFAMDDITAFLRSQPERGRVFPLREQSAWPRAIDYPMYHAVELLGGEHGNQLQRYNEFLGTSRETYADFHNVLSDARFLAAANVRWLVSSAELQGVPFLREAYRGATAIVYENTLALPRAYLAEEVRVIPDADQTLAAMLDPAWDPSRTAIVEAPGELGLPSDPLEGGAELIRYEPDLVEVRTRSNRPALLVLSDNHYKGWHATVDGQPAEIRRTNHTFRGVVVPSGASTVRFTFEPRELYLGFYIYLACIALLLGYGTALVLRARRAATPEPKT